MTPLDALERFGCFRMAARVRDLRDRGHHIHTEIVEQGGKRFARYSLVGDSSRGVVDLRPWQA
ncbi:MAG: helix-turn-helix domain-containing protein [Planctomycetaceae bacterium]